MSNFILFMFTFSCNCFYLFSLSETTPSQHKGTGYFSMAFSLSFWSIFKILLKIFSFSEKLQSRALGGLLMAVLLVQMAQGSIMSSVLYACLYLFELLLLPIT